MTISKAMGKQLMNLSEQIARHVVDSTIDDVDDATVARAKARILDSFGNIVAGRRADGIEAALRVYGDSASDEASVLGFGVTSTAAGAATVNALMMRSWDYEACGAEDAERRLHPGHSSGSTFPTALAVAERRGASGKELLHALVLGDDLTVRLSVASGFNLELGSDNTGITNGLGCVATAAKLDGASVDETIDALGLSLNQLSGTILNIFDGALAFKLPQAMSARNAIQAVDLARGGFTGPDDPIGGRFGFFTAFSDNEAPASLTEQLGTRFYGDKVIKPWSCCRIVQGPVESATKLRTQFSEDEIREIRIVAAAPILKGFTAVPFVRGESTPVSALFNMELCVALAIAFGEVRPEHMNDAVLNSPRVVALHEKAHFIASDDMSPADAIRLEIELTDGTVHSDAVADALGDIYFNPMSREQLLDKYYRNMAFGGVPRDAAERIAAMVDEIESVADVREFTELLVAAPGDASVEVVGASA